MCFALCDCPALLFLPLLHPKESSSFHWPRMFILICGKGQWPPTHVKSHLHTRIIPRSELQRVELPPILALDSFLITSKSFISIFLFYLCKRRNFSYSSLAIPPPGEHEDFRFPGTNQNYWIRLWGGHPGIIMFPRWFDATSLTTFKHHWIQGCLQPWT